MFGCLRFRVWGVQVFTCHDILEVLQLERLTEPNQRTNKRAPLDGEGGQLPSAPRVPCHSNSDIATALVAEHDSRAPEIATLVPHVSASKVFQHRPWH